MGVLVTLAGPQEITVQAYQPASTHARIGVRIGRTLLYLHDTVATQRLAGAWRDAARSAIVLSRMITRPRLPGLRYIPPAAVSVDISRAVPVTVRWIQRERQPSRLNVHIGRLVLDVRDQRAFAWVAAAFQQAGDLAPTTFPILTTTGLARAVPAAARQPPRRAHLGAARPAARGVPGQPARPAPGR